MSCTFFNSVLAITQENQELQRYEVSSPAMGVQLNLIFYATNNELAERAARAARQRVEQIEQILSNYREDSEITLLADKLADKVADGVNEGAVAVSDDLWTVLLRANEISETTGGAFDVTLAPLTDLWRDARKSGKLPSAELIEAAHANVGYQKIGFEHATQSISFDSMLRLDFGAIGKGYAADRALDELKAQGVDAALVDLGGDLAIGSPPPNKAGWTVAIAAPNHEQDKQRFITVSNCGIATSGDTVQFVEIDGVRYSHILDPKSGLGVQRHANVTVFARDGTTADAFASAFSVLGVDSALRISRSSPDVQFLIQEAGLNQDELQNGTFAQNRSERFPEIQSLK